MTKITLHTLADIGQDVRQADPAQPGVEELQHLGGGGQEREVHVQHVRHLQHAGVFPRRFPGARHSTVGSKAAIWCGGGMRGAGGTTTNGFWRI